MKHWLFISSYTHTHVFLPPGGVTGGTPTVGPSSSDLPVYQEVWFIALIAILALIILFIGLACCLRRTRHKVPYIRERMPLVAKQKKMGAPLSYCIDPYTGNVVSTVRKVHGLNVGYISKHRLWMKTWYNELYCPSIGNSSRGSGSTSNGEWHPASRRLPQPRLFPDVRSNAQSPGKCSGSQLW